MDQLLEELKTYGGKVAHVEANFMDPQAPDQVMGAAVDAFGHIDILVANHAYSTMGALEDLTPDEIDKHLLVNVRATMLLIKAFAAQHDERPGGRIIFMTSGQHLGPMPSELAYIASKGALHPLATSLAAYLAPRGITVNVVNPGATDTGYASKELYDEVLALEPQGRWGEPDDAARVIAWLCTDEARWITGQVVNSNGGGP
jgi:3-oxoacyl-[acyl-carrier protein] reductase